MNRFTLIFALVILGSPIFALAPRFDWPIGFSIGGGLAYEYSQQENRGAMTTKLLSKWRNNTLGLSAFMDMTFFMVRTDLRLGMGGDFIDSRVNRSAGSEPFAYHSFGISAYAKIPHVFRERKLWLYFPMIGTEYSLALGGNFNATNPQKLYNDLYVMFGLSGDFQIWKEDFFLKPSFLVGFNVLSQFPDTKSGAGFKVVLGLECGWRFATFNKFR